MRKETLAFAWLTSILAAGGVGYALAPAGSQPTSPAASAPERAPALGGPVAAPAPLPATLAKGRESSSLDTSASAPTHSASRTAPDPATGLAPSAPPATRLHDPVEALVLAFRELVPKNPDPDNWRTDPPRVLDYVLKELEAVVPPERSLALRRAALRHYVDSNVLPADRELALQLVRERVQSPSPENGDLVCDAINQLRCERSLTPAEIEWLESFVRALPDARRLRDALVSVDAERARALLGRDGLSPDDLRALVHGEGPPAREATFALLAAEFDPNLLFPAFRLDRARAEALVAERATDPRWRAAAAVARIHLDLRANQRAGALAFFSSEWQALDDEALTSALISFGSGSVEGSEEVVWGPALTAALERLVQGNPRLGRSALRFAPPWIRVETLPRRPDASQGSELEAYGEYLTHYPFRARAQLGELLAAFPELREREGIALAATFQRLGDAGAAREVLLAVERASPARATALARLERGERVSPPSTSR